MDILENIKESGEIETGRWAVREPLWLRSEPQLPCEVVSRIVRENQKVEREYGVRRSSDDLGVYLNGWVREIREDLCISMSQLLEVPRAECSWFESTSNAATSILAQISDSNKDPNKTLNIYVDQLDNWRFRQIEDEIQRNGNLQQTDDLIAADVLVLTFGTPELGSSSFSHIKPENIKPNQTVIIDAAAQWTAFFTSPYKEIIQQLWENHDVVIIGDFQKVMGYGLNVETQDLGTLTIPVGFSLATYSPSLFQKRLSLAHDPPFYKTEEEMIHWCITDSKPYSNSFAAGKITYPFAFLRLYGEYLGEFTEKALRVAERLRNEFGASGELTIVAQEINESVLAQNNRDGMFVVEAGERLFPVKDVIPSFRIGDQLYGFFRVYPAFFIDSEEDEVCELYHKIYEQFFIKRNT